MECSTPTVTFDIFMDYYFTFFRLLTHHGVNNIRATGVLNKNRLHKGTIIRDSSCKKNQNVATLNSAAHIKQKSSVNLCLVNLRDLFGVAAKLKESIFKNNNETNYTVTTKTSVLSTECIRTWPDAGLVSKRKKIGGGPRLFEW